MNANTKQSCDCVVSRFFNEPSDMSNAQMYGVESLMKPLTDMMGISDVISGLPPNFDIVVEIAPYLLQKYASSRIDGRYQPCAR